MGDLGFWALAHEDPDHLALVAPDGTELTARRAPRPGQPARARPAGLRAGPGRPGGHGPAELPEAIEIYLACLQAGWYLVPINHHLVASEIAYILRDSGTQVFVGHERFSDACVDAADEAEIPGRPAWPWARSWASTPTTACAPPSPPPTPRSAPSATS